MGADEKGSIRREAVVSITLKRCKPEKLTSFGKYFYKVVGHKSFNKFECSFIKNFINFISFSSKTRKSECNIFIQHYFKITI